MINEFGQQPASNQNQNNQQENKIFLGTQQQNNQTANQEQWQQFNQWVQQEQVNIQQNNMPGQQNNMNFNMNSANESPLAKVRAAEHQRYMEEGSDDAFVAKYTADNMLLVGGLVTLFLTIFWIQFGIGKEWDTGKIVVVVINALIMAGVIFIGNKFYKECFTGYDGVIRSKPYGDLFGPKVAVFAETLFMSDGILAFIVGLFIIFMCCSARNQSGRKPTLKESIALVGYSLCYGWNGLVVLLFLSGLAS